MFEATKQAIVQCLPVLPTNPTHTLGRLNTGVHQHVNFTGGSNPAPTDTKTKTNRQERPKVQSDNRTNRQTLTSATAKGYPQGAPVDRLILKKVRHQNATKTHQIQNKKKIIQNQRNKGTNDKLKQKGVKSNTGRTKNTEKDIGRTGNWRNGEAGTGLDQTHEAGT